MAILWNRMVRAAKLDVAFYREMVEDPKSINYSRWVVVLYGMAAAMGTFGKSGALAVNTSVLTIIFGWYVWAFFTYFIGTRLLAEADTPRDRKAVMRAMGYAAAPGIARLIGFVPGLETVALIGGSIWMVVAGTIAAKEALQYRSMIRSAGIVIVCWLLSWLVQMMIWVTVFSALGVEGQGL